MVACSFFVSWCIWCVQGIRVEMSSEWLGKGFGELRVFSIK